jgi:hypothetical protein
MATQPTLVARTLPSGERRDVLKVEGIQFGREGNGGATFFMYVRDNGSGKDQLVIEGDDGSVLVLMTDD